MAGTKTTPDAVTSIRFPQISKTVLTGPLAQTMRVEIGASFQTSKIKAIWNNEVGNAT